MLHETWTVREKAFLAEHQPKFPKRAEPKKNNNSILRKTKPKRKQRKEENKKQQYE